MSLLREVKPRNARTARIVKAREPQQLESRKRVLLLHGSKCPIPVHTVLKTFTTLTKPHSILLNKKNGDIHPFEDPQSLEFLAGKNDCGIVIFGTHSKKRPNNITICRIYNSKVLDLAELLLLNSTQEMEAQSKQPFNIGVEMKPLILFSGSQWDDDSVSDSAMLYRSLKSILLDVFQGEEITSIDVAGLQYVLMIAAGEPSNTSITLNMEDPTQKPVLHLRWYKISTTRSQDPKVPYASLTPTGPTFDFRVGRYKLADQEIMKDALKHGRRPNEARTKKNIETDLVGDKLGRVHLGKQDLSTLQTRKMKGLKRSRDDDDDITHVNGVNTNGNGIDEDDAEISMDDNDEDMEDGTGGMNLDDEDVDGLLSDGGEDGEEGSSTGGTGDEIDIGESDDDAAEEDVQADVMPKRQRIG